MLYEEICCGLYRVRVPFQDLTTTVYIARYDEGAAIIDSATYPSDVDNYIIPALCELGIGEDDVRWLLITHTHSDHAGGLPRLSELFPRARVGFVSELDHSGFRQISDGEVLLGGLQVVSLPGHTKNCVGYLDIKTRTLLSGDCLQLRGIGKYRNGVGQPKAYAESVARLSGMDIRRIVAAHEYDPLGSLAEGEESAREYLRECLSACELL